MRQDWYEVLVLAARYWFALLGAIVVWRSFGWLRKEARQRKRKLRQLPDAGFIGAYHVIEGESRAIQPGDALSVPMEGVIGSASGCDIRVQHPSVAGRHALFEFRSEGLRLRPFREEPLRVDDQALSPGCEAVLRHGAMLTLGAVMLQLRLFAGMEQEMDEIDEPARPVRSAPRKASKKKNTGGAKKALATPIAGTAKKRGGRRQDKGILGQVLGEDPEEEFFEPDFFQQGLSEEESEEESYEEKSSEEQIFFDEEQPLYDDNPIYGGRKRRRR